jgi:hypothetical protein
LSPRQRDKEWAALTTWLRMNLHHVSGSKVALLRCVCAAISLQHL